MPDYLDGLKLSAVKTLNPIVKTTAVLNGSGVYVFNAVNLPIYPALSNTGYIIDNFYLASNINDNAWLNSLKTPINIKLKNQLIDLVLNVYDINIPFLSQPVNLRLPYKFYNQVSNTNPNYLSCDLTGEIEQTASIMDLGITQLDLYLAFTIYQVADPQFLQTRF